MTIKEYIKVGQFSQAKHNFVSLNCLSDNLCSLRLIRIFYEAAFSMLTFLVVVLPRSGCPTTPLSDCLIFSFKLLVSGALSASFIPIFTTYLHRDETEANQLASNVINILFTAFFSTNPTISHLCQPAVSSHRRWFCWSSGVFLRLKLPLWLI